MTGQAERERNPGADLLRTLDRGLTLENLDAMPTKTLQELSGLLFHWHELVDMRLERRPRETAGA
jgi:hypothetical protein